MTGPSKATTDRREKEAYKTFYKGYQKGKGPGLVDIVDNSWRWAEKYRTYMGNPVDYKASRLEPWKALMESPSLNKVVMKSRKVTASEQMINECFYKLERNPYCHFAMVFPQQYPHANEFSTTRINPAIEDSPRLRRALRPPSAIESKSFKFRAGDLQKLYIYGVMGSGGSPGDKLRSLVLRGTFYDEVQLIPLEAHSVIDQAKKPDIEEYDKWCSGTPTTPGNCLNSVFWDDSDQNKLLFKCPSCGEWNDVNVKENVRYLKVNPLGEFHPEFSYPLDFHNSVQDAFLACKFCSTSLEPYRGYLGRFDDGAISQWVPQQIQKQFKYNGFFLNKLILGLESIPSILRQLMDPQYSKRKCYNEILGYPYVGEDSPFSLDAMKPCLLHNLFFRDVSREQFDYFVATVDWGKPSWFCVHGLSIQGKICQMMLLDIGRTKIDDEREHGKELTRRLYKKWPELDLIICDEGYSTMRWKDFRNAFNTKIVYAISSSTGSLKNIERDQFNIDLKTLRSTHIIKAPRDFLLETFEECLDPIETRWFVPYAEPDKLFDGLELSRYLLHCSNVYRQPLSEFKSIQKPVIQIEREKTAYYKDSGSPDHSLLIFSYASILNLSHVRKILIRRSLK